MGLNTFYRRNLKVNLRTTNVTNMSIERKRILTYSLKPLQNKKGQKNLGYPKKSSLFPYKRTAFLSGTPNFFCPSYFEAALVLEMYNFE